MGVRVNPRAPRATPRTRTSRPPSGRTPRTPRTPRAPYRGAGSRAGSGGLTAARFAGASPGQVGGRLDRHQGGGWSATNRVFRHRCGYNTSARAPSGLSRYPTRTPSAVSGHVNTRTRAAAAGSGSLKVVQGQVQ